MNATNIDDTVGIAAILRYAEEAATRAKNAETMGKFLYHKGRALGVLEGLLIIVADPALNITVSAQISEIKKLDYEPPHESEWDADSIAFYAEGMMSGLLGEG